MPRPKGLAKTGGRKKGTKNKRTIALEQAAKEGNTPLQFMLDTMRDDKVDMALRCDMAKAAAPYLHARRAPEDKKGRVVPPVIYGMPSLEAPPTDAATEEKKIDGETQEVQAPMGREGDFESDQKGTDEAS
jgi:hypothetical protein